VSCFSNLTYNDFEDHSATDVFSGLKENNCHYCSIFLKNFSENEMKGFNSCKCVCTSSSKNCAFSDGLLCKNNNDLSSNRPKGHSMLCVDNTCYDLKCLPFNSPGNLFDCVTHCFDYSINPISVDHSVNPISVDYSVNPISVDYNVNCEQYDISSQPKVINSWHNAHTGVTCDNVNSSTNKLDCNCSSDGFNVSNGIKDHVNNFGCLYHKPDYNVGNADLIAINDVIYKLALHDVSGQNLKYLDSTSNGVALVRWCVVIILNKTTRSTYTM
jgi:hypothetical protein